MTKDGTPSYFQNHNHQYLTPNFIWCALSEIKVVLVNLSKDEFTIHPNDRIAQMVFTNAIQVTFKEVQDLDQTKRGDGGFGSTGKD